MGTPYMPPSSCNLSCNWVGEGASVGRRNSFRFVIGKWQTDCNKGRRMMARLSVSELGRKIKTCRVGIEKPDEYIKKKWSHFAAVGRFSLNFDKKIQNHTEPHTKHNNNKKKVNTHPGIPTYCTFSQVEMSICFTDFKQNKCFSMRKRACFLGNFA